MRHLFKVLINVGKGSVGLKGLPKLERRKLGFLLKKFAKGLGMFKTKCISDFTYRQVASG